MAGSDGTQKDEEADQHMSDAKSAGAEDDDAAAPSDSDQPAVADESEPAEDPDEPGETDRPDDLTSDEPELADEPSTSDEPPLTEGSDASDETDQRDDSAAASADDSVQTLDDEAEAASSEDPSVGDGATPAEPPFDPFALDDDFDLEESFSGRYASSRAGATREPQDEDRERSLFDTDDDSEGYAEITRSDPGMNLSRWIIVGVVTIATILLSFILIPRLIDSASDDDDESASPTSSEAPATSSAPAQLGYGQTVLNLGPQHYWRFASANPTADDIATSNLTLGKDSLPLGSSAVKDSVGSMDCDGTKRSSIFSQTPEPATGDFTIETWFSTVSDTGGQLVSFGDEAESTSDTVTRTLYVNGIGHVYVGVKAGKRMVAYSDKGYADGAWHHVVGTYSGTAGLALYVDGQQVASKPAATDAQDLETGHWKICGDSLSSWPSASGGPYYLGSVDEVAVYNVALSPEQVAASFAAAQVG